MILELNLNIYPLDIIRLAIKQYREISCVELSVNEASSMVVLEFSQCKYDAALVKNEFCNFLIQLINSKGIMR